MSVQENRLRDTRFRAARLTPLRVWYHRTTLFHSLLLDLLPLDRKIAREGEITVPRRSRRHHIGDPLGCVRKAGQHLLHHTLPNAARGHTAPYLRV